MLLALLDLVETKVLLQNRTSLPRFPCLFQMLFEVGKFTESVHEVSSTKGLRRMSFRLQERRREGRIETNSQGELALTHAHLCFIIA
jgi:hypothetical protein